MKSIIKNALILTMITLVAGTALAVVYSITKEPIEKSNKKATMEAYSIVFSDAQFEEISLKDYNDENNSKISAVSKAVKDGKAAGYVFTTASKGYGGDIKLAVGIDLAGSITGISVLDASNETPGLGARVQEDEFTAQFKNINSDTLNDVDAISGATYSSKGVKNAVSASLKYFNDNLKEEGK
ncbi:MAG: RnfABCDGE type electron transport complex subunit G [Clostridia bacterium]|nr:RnfABCDGE type electron transport complex subunit G [Clostridia bacterium]